MNTKTFSLTVTLFFVAPSLLLAQIKYVGEEKGATMISAGYSGVESTDAVSGQINYTHDGRMGLGAFFAYTNSPHIIGVGVQAEYALYRPVNETMVGINLEAGAAHTWTSVPTMQPYSAEVNSGYNAMAFQSTTYIYGQSAVVGAEVYLHSPSSDFRVEPFLDLARTFSKITESETSQTSALNSVGLGFDIILGSTMRNFIVATPGVSFEEDSQPSLAINLSFVHAFN